MGIISSMNYKLFADDGERERERSLSRMCESFFFFFFKALQIQMLCLSPLPSPFSLVKPRPNHKPPCVISQQCFWPPGLMAQCSLYDMYCLKGRSALLFRSNLIPKLFKHQGFSSKYRIKSVYVPLSVCMRERETEVQRWLDSECLQSNILFGKILFSILSIRLSFSLFLSCCLSFVPSLPHDPYLTF